MKRGHPNTYTLTKSLAEDLVHSYRDRFNITIVRPSIILAAVSEPFPGWVENYSGPTSLLVGLYNGIFRTVLCDKKKLIKFVPIDVVVNATIVATCKRTMMSTNDVFYCNITDSPNNVMSWEFMFTTLTKLAQDYPIRSTLWYPSSSSISNVSMYRLSTIFRHFLPCYLFDFLGVAGKKIKFVCWNSLSSINILINYYLYHLRLFEIQKKLNSVMVIGFKYFTTSSFDFRTDNFNKLHTEMSSHDQIMFNCDVENVLTK